MRGNMYVVYCDCDFLDYTLKESTIFFCRFDVIVGIFSFLSSLFLSASIFLWSPLYSRFGTWPVAMLAQSKSKAILEGPVCNGSQVIGWHTNEKSKQLRRFHVDMSGFAFNSTILWDPKKWHRPTSDPIRQLDNVKEGFQVCIIFLLLNRWFLTFGIEVCVNRLKLEIYSHWLLAGDHFHRTNCWRRKPNGGCPSWLLKGIDLAPSPGSSWTYLSERLATSKEPWCRFLFHMRNTSKVQRL